MFREFEYRSASLAKDYFCVIRAVSVSTLATGIIESLMDTTDPESDARVDAIRAISNIETEIGADAVCQRAPWLMTWLENVARAERLSGIAYLGKWSAFLRKEQIVAASHDLSVLLSRLRDEPGPVLWFDGRDRFGETRRMSAHEVSKVHEALAEPVTIPGFISGGDEEARYPIRFLNTNKAILQQALARDLCVIYLWI